MDVERATDGHTKADAKPLGLVWINCCYPVLARGLATILKTEANFIWRYEPRMDKAPSIVVYCSESEDYTQELKRLQTLLPNTPILILVLPGKVDLSYAWQALQTGIAGFIHADMEPLEVVQAFYSASKGDVVIPKDLATALLQSLVKRRELSAELGALTYRKREILNLVAEGLTNA